MKVNKKLMYTAMGNALFKMYSSKKIADTVASIINEEKANAVEVDTSCTDGFSLRCHKDMTFSDSYLYGAIADATQELLDAQYEDVLDYIADTYDLPYDSKYASDEYAREIFDISRSGRIINIEADL